MYLKQKSNSAFARRLGEDTERVQRRTMSQPFGAHLLISDGILLVFSYSGDVIEIKCVILQQVLPMAVNGMRLNSEAWEVPERRVAV